MLKDVEYYSGDDLRYPDRPQKPVVKNRDDPASIRRYADKLESYYAAADKYRIDKQVYRDTIKERKQELMLDLAAENELSPAQAEVLFYKAWEEGHSGGISEVIDSFTSLVDLIAEFQNQS